MIVGKDVAGKNVEVPSEVVDSFHQRFPGKCMICTYFRRTEFLRSEVNKAAFQFQAGNYDITVKRRYDAAPPTHECPEEAHKISTALAS
jgi:hypothetical protein